MTWQGGKRPQETGPVAAFARLKPFADDKDDPAKSLQKLAKALSRYGRTVSLHFRLVTGQGGEDWEDWEVKAGSKGGKVSHTRPKKPDVVIVLRPETWAQIAQGRLAPYEALYTGRLRVGGDFEEAKAITRHLTDPAFAYLAPC